MSRAKAAKIAIQAFALSCPEPECGESVINPETGSYSFIEGMDVPAIGTALSCDAGHVVRMPRW